MSARLLCLLLGVATAIAGGSLLARPADRPEGASPAASAGVSDFGTEQIRQARSIIREQPTNAHAWCELARASLLEHGFDKRTARQLAACYRFGTREVSLFEARLYMAMTVWPLLDDEVRAAALGDAVNALDDQNFAHWMADRLALVAVAVAPERAAMVSTLVTRSGESVRATFRDAVANYTSHAEARSKAK